MISVVLDSVLHQDVDAIVNPANSYMLHGGGLAAVIASRGGEELVKASQEQVPVKTGDAIITTAGKLPFKAVIHTVGPVWEPDSSEPYWRQNHPKSDPRVIQPEDFLLREAHRSAMDLAAEAGLRSVAFPAVSCGVFRFPVERAAPIAVEAVRDYGIEVIFCVVSDEHYDAFSKALE